MQSVKIIFCRCPSKRGSSGFILVATLFAIAVIGIGAAYFASRVEGLQAAAFQQQALAEAERELVSIGHALMQASLVNPLTESGLVVKGAQNDPLVLDGRWYRMTNIGQLAVQDERGLISLNIADDNQLRRLFSTMGIPVERHDRLIDTLRDYVDIDDLKHLNGAERRDYIAANLAPPANDFLTTRDELRRVLGWRDLLNELETKGTPGAAERFLGYFSAHRMPAINVNTAPRLVMQSIANVDQARVGAFLDQRRVAPFRSALDLAPFMNGAIDFEAIQLVGANTWRLTYQRDDLAFLIECRLVITPAASEKAVQINECRHRPKNSVIGDGDMEEFARVFGTLSLNAPSANFVKNSVGNPGKNSSSHLSTNASAASIFSPNRPILNREVSQRASNYQQLLWLKLQAGLMAAPVTAPANQRQ